MVRRKERKIKMSLTAKYPSPWMRKCIAKELENYPIRTPQQAKIAFQHARGTCVKRCVSYWQDHGMNQHDASVRCSAAHQVRHGRRRGKKGRRRSTRRGAIHKRPPYRTRASEKIRRFRKWVNDEEEYKKRIGFALYLDHLKK